MCNEMIDTIMDGDYPGNKRKLYDEIGIETDEDVQFAFVEKNK